MLLFIREGGFGQDRDLINHLTRRYEHPQDFFVERLSEGVGTIAAAFYPKPVIIRLSDFKTNEYAGLIGGAGFEPKEDNPMIGFRGASRYTHPAYAEGFRARMRGLAAGAQRDGSHQPFYHGPVLPPRRGGQARY